mmetsp:Transcript_60360/g.169227  ORF Transcript_60360/g.169227 Transcript_60360/m.169227 type:complete len:239 (+) Transcript_60360:63-779(+)
MAAPPRRRARSHISFSRRKKARRCSTCHATSTPSMSMMNTETHTTWEFIRSEASRNSISALFSYSFSAEMASALASVANIVRWTPFRSCFVAGFRENSVSPMSTCNSHFSAVVWNHLEPWHCTQMRCSPRFCVMYAVLPCSWSSSPTRLEKTCLPEGSLKRSMQGTPGFSLCRYLTVRTCCSGTVSTKHFSSPSCTLKYAAAASRGPAANNAAVHTATRRARGIATRCARAHCGGGCR